jgi:hypothetical protein
MFITSVLLWDGVFGKWTGGIGLAGFAMMSVFFVLTAFVPGLYRTAIMISAPGGLLLMAYQLMLASCWLTGFCRSADKTKGQRFLPRTGCQASRFRQF